MVSPYESISIGLYVALFAHVLGTYIFKGKIETRQATIRCMDFELMGVKHGPDQLPLGFSWSCILLPIKSLDVDFRDSSEKRKSKEYIEYL